MNMGGIIISLLDYKYKYNAISVRVSGRFKFDMIIWTLQLHLLCAKKSWALYLLPADTKNNFE